MCPAAWRKNFCFFGGRLFCRLEASFLLPALLASCGVRETSVSCFMPSGSISIASSTEPEGAAEAEAEAEEEGAEVDSLGTRFVDAGASLFLTTGGGASVRAGSGEGTRGFFWRREIEAFHF